MQRFIMAFLFVLVSAFSFVGCISTQINIPVIQERNTSKLVPLKIEFLNLPNDSSIAIQAPAGNRAFVHNNPGRLDTLMIPAIEKIVRNKGYSVVSPGEEAKAVLTVDFADFSILWMSGMISSNGAIKANISHAVGNRKNNNKIWSWKYDGSKEYGKLPGNLVAFAAGFTIIGIIPFIIYVNAQGGDEGSQMTKAGNELLLDYFIKLDESLPEASVLESKLK